MRQILILVLSLLLLGCGKKEPLHKGKPASYWREALKNEDPKERREAVIAMGGLKVKDAIPELIALLKDQNTELRSCAAQAFWSLGDADAKEAVPALIILLQDKDTGVRLNATGALGQIASEPGKTIPALRDALINDNDSYVRAQAATGLGFFRQCPP